MPPPALGLALYRCFQSIRGRDDTAIVRELRRSERRRPEELVEHQLIKLRALLRHAYDSVPFYRDRMDDAGIRPEKMGNLKELDSFPCTSREDINDNLERLVSEKVDRRTLIKTGTGGSTGEPLTYYLDLYARMHAHARVIRNRDWIGVPYGEPTIFFWGSAFDVNALRDLPGKVANWLTNTRYLPCFSITDATLAEYGRFAQRFRPALLAGYTTPLCDWAEYIDAHPDLRFTPRAVVMRAERVYQNQQDLLERVFGCRAYNAYGCREVGDIAHECSEGTIHVNADDLLVELLVDGRPAKPGQIGEIAITDFHNYGMPFIRYLIGDLAVWKEGSCSCGRSLPAFQRIEGRVVDIIVLPGGKRLPGEFFPHLLKDYPVRRYQVEQDQEDHIVIRCVPRPGFSPEDTESILGHVRDYVGPVVSVDLQLVERIPTTPSGKHRPVISCLGSS